MKQSKKVSDTSIRVLETLKMLSEKKASIQDILRYFEKTAPNNRIYTNEVILKYINTLKVFGFRIAKEKDKYVLLNSPCQFDLNKTELKALKLLENFTRAFPEEKIKFEMENFLKNLEKRYSDNTRIILNTINEPIFKNFKLNYQKYSKQIKEYEKYCLDEQRLKITYKKQNQIEASVIVEPCEIKYIENDVYFSVYNPLSAQIQNINFKDILKIEQLPSKINPQSLFSSVTFKLKDRLAKVYKLRDVEKLLQLNPDNSIVVLNQKEDRAILLRRLMRYGENCEIISPKALREEMSHLIKSTISNYL